MHRGRAGDRMRLLPSKAENKALLAAVILLELILFVVAVAGHLLCWFLADLRFFGGLMIAPWLAGLALYLSKRVFRTWAE